MLLAATTTTTPTTTIVNKPIVLMLPNYFPIFLKII